ncbi:MAG: magnesium transporter [Leptospiraceae bacterium]|nr:magnesium transporter [Leptospiraceae bacterium]MCB1304534.1 magnesium transporter [Leptospiraceae bacterium]
MSDLIVLPEIEELIEQRKSRDLKNRLKELRAGDLAELIQDLPDNHKAVVFRLLPRELTADTFEYLEFRSQQHLLKTLAKNEVAAILNEMKADDRTALLEELPGFAVKQLLELLTPDERIVAVQHLGYPEDSVGRLMVPDFISVRPEWTVQKVLEHIRKNGKDSESINVIYVTDDRGRLIDDLRIREILLASPRKKVQDLMDESYLFLEASDDREQAVDVFKKYDRVALPVVNSERFLLGIVTVDDVLDVIEEEHTEDIQKFGGLDALETPYMHTGFFQMIKRRVGWLIVLFIGQMFTVTAMSFFQGEIAAAVVLGIFIPLIISSGGNSGSQAATLIIRALSLGEVNLADWWVIMRREILAGLTLGAILGLIGFLRVLIWPLFSTEYGEHFVLLGIVVGVSLLGVVLWGTITGAMLPLALQRLGFDPAASSAPFVSMLVDVTGLVIYFSVALLILRGTLL